MTASEAAIFIYENEVPAFVETEMERLYGNIFSSLTQFRIYGWTGGETSTYLVRQNDVPIVILLFRRHDRGIQVLNEGIALDDAELARFSEFMFSRYPDVNVISFKAIETTLKRMRFPHQRFNHLEDMTLALPASADEYFAGLGKHTRHNIRRHLARIEEAFPSFRFEVFEKTEMTPQRVREIIEFNRARMAEKNIVSIIDERETQHIVDLVQARGFVGVITIDGRLCAGAISFQSGQNYFLNVLAHDPCYDSYWLGFLCCYLTIRECIGRGGGEFHFLWGRYTYKFLLGAVQRDLDNVIVYRSRMRLLRNLDIACASARRGYVRALKIWLRYEDGFLAQRARRLLERLRAWRRSARGSAVGGNAALLGASQEK